nr:TIGR03885 family FMN-dependent LLM class oxidoreductase [Altericroceibacterium xinjiangense]
MGFHASHEQFPPEELLKLASLAQQAGFDAAMCSDHFHPWSPSQGQSGFTWSWLGAAMQATQLPFGTMAIPGGWRYHPAIVAQAGATLSRMFPGRFLWLALGSGEALNERIVGQGWPEKAERNRRLKEAAEIIRALWAGETVNRDGAIPVEDARLYTGPHDPPPLLYGAALSPETAGWLGGWADGLLTVGAKTEQLRPIVDAFRRGGGEGKKLGLQVHVSWAASEEEAREQAHTHWRFNVVPPGAAELLRTPEQFDAATSTVRPEDMEDYVLMSPDPAFYVEALREFRSLGFEEIYVHNVGTNQREFVEAFGREVLPHLHE